MISVKACSCKIVGVLAAALLLNPSVHAIGYEVLVIDVAGACDREKITEFEKDAKRFNELHRKGYPSVKPYFNVLQMADWQIYFVFGFRDRVQGIHRRNYPNTERNLRRLRQNGYLKYPNPNWIPVEEIRRLLPRN